MQYGKIAAFMLTPLALLAVTPVRAGSDPRLILHPYDATEVVRIVGRLGVQATIAFEDSEQIENVAVGDSQKWQITPNKRANLLFVKPLEPAAVTNMTVVTNRRTYLFDLVASAKDQPVYMFQFTYGAGSRAPAAGPIAAPALATSAPSAAPQAAATQGPGGTPALAASQPAKEKPAKPTKRERPARTAIDEAVRAPVQDSEQPTASVAPKAALAEPAAAPDAPRKRSRTASIPVPVAAPAAAVAVGLTPNIPAAAVPTTEAGALNFGWSRKGNAALLPLRVYDDGIATYLFWRAGQSIPAILVTDAAGQEVPAQATATENTVTLSGVPARIQLRSGQDNATLENLRVRRAANAALAGRD